MTSETLNIEYISRPFRTVESEHMHVFSISPVASDVATDIRLNGMEAYSIHEIAEAVDAIAALRGEMFVRLIDVTVIETA